jgi:hypothetical protein
MSLRPSSPTTQTTCHNGLEQLELCGRHGHARERAARRRPRRRPALLCRRRRLLCRGQDGQEGLREDAPSQHGHDSCHGPRLAQKKLCRESLPCAHTHARTHARATRMGDAHGREQIPTYTREHMRSVGMLVAHRRVSESACPRPRARTRAHTHVCKRAYIEYVVCWGGGCVGGIALTCVPASLPHAQLGMKMPTHGVNLKDKENNVHSATPARSASALPCIPSVTH